MRPYPQETPLFPASAPVSNDRRLLRQRHRILTPLSLLMAACLFCVASLYSDRLFPLLALLGVSVVPLCLSLALVSGIAGILIGIINLLECIDRRCQAAAIFSKPKERSYATSN